MARRGEQVDEPLVGKTVREHRHMWERVVVGMFAMSGVLTIGGLALSILAFRGTETYGVYAAALGLLCLAITTELAHPLQTLHTIGTGASGGAKYDRLRNWNRLKAVSILLNLLTIVAGVLLLGAILTRANLLNLDLNYVAALNLTGVFSIAIAGALLYALFLSLRTPLQRVRLAGPEGALFRIFLWAALTLALVASFLTYRGIDEIAGRQLGQFRAIDIPFLLLAAFAAASVGVYLSRSLPTTYALFTEERDFYRGRNYMSTKKSVVMPTMIAFALLFIVLLVLIVFQLGVVGLVEEIPQNYVLLGVFAIIGVSMIAAVAVSVVLSRSEDRVDLYKVKRSREARREITILAVSAAIAVVFLIIAALLYSGVNMPLGRDRWVDMFTFAVLVSIGPFGFYYARKQKRIRQLEERFPDFLRDLAASRRAGLTLHSAVQIAARGEYGALTPEIQKMADQLSWNVPFNEAMDRFGERVQTPLVQRATTLINEAGRSGGNVTDVLLAAASDAREIKNLENERRTTMVLYSVVTYITFFVFLVVVAILYGTFIPEILSASAAAVAGGATNVGGVSFTQSVDLADFRVFFFMAALMQGLGNGTIAGLMESGRVLNGLRHAFIMAVITYLTFAFILP